MVRSGPDKTLVSVVSTRIMGSNVYIDPSYMETGQGAPPLFCVCGGKGQKGYYHLTQGTRGRCRAARLWSEAGAD